MRHDLDMVNSLDPVRTHGHLYFDPLLHAQYPGLHSCSMGTNVSRTIWVYVFNNGYRAISFPFIVMMWIFIVAACMVPLSL